MSTRRRWMPVTPHAVWDVLCNGWVYPVFVVGTAHMRAVDEAWPAPGAQLHHAVGGWPLMLTDTTTCHAAVPQQRLEMTARGWPAGEARVVITLVERGAGTLVTIEEDASAGPALLVPSPLRRALIGLRNRETLSRLEDLAVGRRAPAA